MVICSLRGRRQGSVEVDVAAAGRRRPALHRLAALLPAWATIAAVCASVLVAVLGEAGASALPVGSTRAGARTARWATAGGRLANSHLSTCLSDPLAPQPGKPPHPKGFFPLPRYEVTTAGSIRQSSPTFAQAMVPGSGGHLQREGLVAFADEQGWLYVIDAATCTELPGWPRRVTSPGAPGLHGVVESAPAFAWWAGADEPPSIVVSVGSTWVNTGVGEVAAFGISGNELWSFPVHPTPGNDNGVFSTPAIGPVVPGTGEDVVFGAWDYYLYVLSREGKLLAKYYNGETIWSSPALYRLPGQRGDDIFIGLDKSQTGIPGGCIGGFFTELRYGALAGHPGHNGLYAVNSSPCQGRTGSKGTGQAIWSSPAIGNLGGKLVAAVGTSFYDQPYGLGTDEVYVYPLGQAFPPGHWEPTWRGQTDGPVLASPAIGSLAGAGGSTEPMLVDTSFDCPPTGPATLASCSRGASSLVEAWRVPAGRPPAPSAGLPGAPLQLAWSRPINGPGALGSPILVPLLGERGNDVVAGAGGGLYPLSGATGQFLYETTTSDPLHSINSSCRVFDTPAVGEVSGPGPYEGWYLFELCSDGVAQTGGLYAFPLPKAPGAPPAWPMFRGFPSHDAVAWSTLAGAGVAKAVTGPSGT